MYVPHKEKQQTKASECAAKKHQKSAVCQKPGLDSGIGPRGKAGHVKRRIGRGRQSWTVNDDVSIWTTFNS